MSDADFLPHGLPPIKIMAKVQQLDAEEQPIGPVRLLQLKTKHPSGYESTDTAPFLLASAEVAYIRIIIGYPDHKTFVMKVTGEGEPW